MIEISDAFEEKSGSDIDRGQNVRENAFENELTPGNFCDVCVYTSDVPSVKAEKLPNHF